MGNFIFCAVRNIFPDVGNIIWSRSITEAYSEPYQVSKMKLLLKIVNGTKKTFTMFAKFSILDARKSSGYASASPVFVLKKDYCLMLLNLILK